MQLMVQACSPDFRLTTSSYYHSPPVCGPAPPLDHFYQCQEIGLHDVHARCVGLSGVLCDADGSSVLQEHICVFVPARYGAASAQIAQKECD